LIKVIKPKTVFPVNTERLGLLKHYISDLECLVKPPEKDKKIQIKCANNCSLDKKYQLYFELTIWAAEACACYDGLDERLKRWC